MSRQRRDPRTEREAKRQAGGSRARFTIELPATPRRLRRDPRLEAVQARVPGARRLRLDRGEHVGMAPVQAAPVAEAAAGPRRIDNPAYLVLVVPDAAGGRLSPHDRQLLGAGRILADAGGGAVMVAAHALAEDPGLAGADRTLALAQDGYDPEGRTAALLGAIRTFVPRHVLFPETVDGGDLARRVAVELGEPLFAAAESVTPKAVTRAARGRRAEQRRVPPRLLSVVADAVAPHGGPPHEASAVEPPPTPEIAHALKAERLAADASAVPLAEAGFVVSAGNGLTDLDTFKALAKALGATPGASRVLCDAGLMPRSAQVGASGTVLEADCYFALGIAGAPQHLQGIARCEHVLAVNTDLHAAMVERAGLAIIADAQAVMPALLKALKA